MLNFTDEIHSFILKWQLSIQWSQIYGPKRVKKEYNSFDKFIFVDDGCQTPFQKLKIQCRTKKLSTQGVYFNACRGTSRLHVIPNFERGFFYFPCNEPRTEKNNYI